MAKKSPAKKTAAQQKLMEGEGFHEPLPKEIQKAVGVYLTAKREAAEKVEERESAMQRVIELGHKHKLDRIQIEGENKFIEIGTRDTCKVKTKPKDKEDRRKKGENDHVDGSAKPEFEKD